ncbi:type I-E CRISPR-associated protein Cas6/Cse3/CasE [Chitiniphilus eburneus]|uniref:Type I-E CRISPR-associated protein Cas6/Cse3/CasE n=1 Tax=Chitiniphilus eburneus TaxID=2571148 RepID=A0A4U0PQV4_9NEIS|nr:type I-E CRISPR-associated protein Cas6/Cse3/CasE [Chitiniphilus eburneus]TJZ70706.1 type I-E CRISPR-associated protein Cas6/Cse3/CasE [Chitiniphilus eburneus]
MSHFFSRVALLARPSEHAWLRDLGRFGEMYRDHALLWRLFAAEDQPRDFIFRSERSAAAHPVYYVVSQRQPKEQPGIFAVHSKPYAPALSAGDWLEFDLRANPTVSRHGADGKSRRHDVLMHAKQSAAEGADVRNEMDRAAADWLVQRALGLGLEIAAEQLLTMAYAQHRLHRKGTSIAFSSLDYRGLAKVTDPAALSRALTQGVGHAKGFGCGLLLVRRAL